MITEKSKYKYSKHAKDEWVKDEHGFIRHYPRTFLSAGCKHVEKITVEGKEDEERYRVTYRYDDRTDLVLVCTKDAFVITNYRTLNLKNKTNYRGSFYLESPKTKKKY